MNIHARRFVMAVVITVGVVACTGGQTATQQPTPSPSATEEPSPSSASAPALSQTFTSALHGISLMVPEEWTARAATEQWTDETFSLDFNGSHADFIYDPALTSDLFMTVASQPIGDATPDDWTTAQMASGEGCASSDPVTVDGASGLVGPDGCNVAVVTSGDRGYWIQLYTGDAAPVVYDTAWFSRILDTVRLAPDDAID